MSDYQQPQQPAAPAPTPAPAAEVPVVDLLGDRTFRPGHKNPQTGRIDQLHISVKNNCVRFAGDVSADGSGQWAALLLPKVEWGMFKQSLQRMALAKEECSETFKCYAGQERRHDASIKVSRSADGIVSLTMISPDGPSKQYDFTLGPNTEVFDSNNVPLAPSEVSRRRALAWKDEIAPMVDKMFEKLFRDFNQRQADGQGNGGGNRQFGGNGGGGFKKQWGGQGGGNNGGFKKQWGGQGGGNGGFKKQWNNNGGGGNRQFNGNGGGNNNYNGGGQGGGNNYQQRYQQPQGNNYQQQPAAPAVPAPTVNFEDYMP